MVQDDASIVEGCFDCTSSAPCFPSAGSQQVNVKLRLREARVGDPTGPQRNQGAELDLCGSYTKTSIHQ